MTLTPELANREQRQNKVRPTTPTSTTSSSQSKTVQDQNPKTPNIPDSIHKTPKTTFHDSIFQTPNFNNRSAQVTFGNFSDLENLVSFLEQTVVQSLTKYKL